MNLVKIIEDLAATPGIESDTALLLKMAAEAQKTGKMPPLPISLEPMPIPFSAGSSTGDPPLKIGWTVSESLSAGQN